MRSDREGKMPMLKRMGILSMVLLLALSLVACSGGSDAEEGGSTSKEKKRQLIVADYGGASSEAAAEAWYKPFEEKHNVEVVVVPNDIGKLKAMATSDKMEWDVLIYDTHVALNMADEGLLTPIDYDIVEKADLDPAVNTDYTVGAQYSYLTLSYNTDLFPGDNHPTSWKEFWDVNAFPGARSLWKYPLTTLEAALLADGVAHEDMYPLDVDRALASLDKLGDNLKVWWDAGAQAPQLLATEELAVAGAWNGRIANAKAEGAAVDLNFSEAIEMLDSWIIPKGAPNEDLAQEFIAFATQPEGQAEYARIIHYAPTNPKGFDLLTDEEKANLGEGQENMLRIDYEYWAEHYEDVNDEFNKWLLK